MQTVALLRDKHLFRADCKLTFVCSGSPKHDDFSTKLRWNPRLPAENYETSLKTRKLVTKVAKSIKRSTSKAMQAIHLNLKAAKHSAPNCQNNQNDGWPGSRAGRE
jgi:hypothetical protein